MAQRGNTWECPLGDGQSYEVTIFSNGVKLTGQYAGTEPLTAYVWEGNNQTPLVGVLTPTWISGPDATTACVLNGNATAVLTQGWYRVRLDVTYGGAQSPYYNGWLHLTPIPGTAVEPPMYGCLQDLLDRGGDWLPRLMQRVSETNFLFEPGRARSWLDDIITNHSRVFAYRFDLNYALYYGSFPFGPVEAPDQVIAGYLALNYLQVVDKTIEIVAYKALALICEHRMEFDTDGENYQKRAAYCNARAEQALRGYRCTLHIATYDETQHYPDIAFNLGVFTFR